MRRILMAMLMSVMVMVCGICSAQITEKDLNIGGIYIGQSMDEIVAKYGNPIRKEPWGAKGNAYVFVINGSEIAITLSKDRDVCGFSIKGNSKLILPSGIGLYASMDSIIKTYGQPDFNKVVARTDRGNIIHFGYKTPERKYSPDLDNSPMIYDMITFIIDVNNNISSIFVSTEVVSDVVMP
ncbi:MAG: hypothetical protein SPL86_06880 [Succiniclasticum sp.]|uniref:hypothetical protein n=1 Tax=Succiniclasticum sp. TaxID=2775030 RepID=UPI002A912705|nr:hypothetical protein [Succiniclasticum sp.]MDY6291191.1 hypothetical protein [Succiniclasticum sp.]